MRTLSLKKEQNNMCYLHALAMRAKGRISNRTLGVNFFTPGSSLGRASTIMVGVQFYVERVKIVLNDTISLIEGIHTDFIYSEIYGLLDDDIICNDVVDTDQRMGVVTNDTIIKIPHSLLIVRH